MIKIVEWSERVRAVRIFLTDLHGVVPPDRPYIEITQNMDGGKVFIAVTDVFFRPDSVPKFVNNMSQAAIFAETLRFAYDVPESTDLAKRLIESFEPQP